MGRSVRRKTAKTARDGASSGGGPVAETAPRRGARGGAGEGRNRVVGAQLSEHGRANALDVRAFKLASGRAISLTDRNVARELREAVLHSACTHFPTVLGPGSDWYHEDHIHLDLMERRNNYRICQWNVWDPLPHIAPLLPAERPKEAPPRQTAAKPAEDELEPAQARAANSHPSRSMT